jgi:hypothetical protein
MFELIHYRLDGYHVLMLSSEVILYVIHPSVPFIGVYIHKCVHRNEIGRREVRRVWGQSLSVYLYGDVMRIVLDLLDGSTNVVYQPSDLENDTFDPKRDTIEGVPSTRPVYGYWRCGSLTLDDTNGLHVDDVDESLYDIMGSLFD